MQKVLDRHIRRLDMGLRALTLREEFPADWNGPSLLTATGTNTPAAGRLRLGTGNIGSTGGMPNMAKVAQMRQLQTTGGKPAPPAVMMRQQREGSSDAAKLRRSITNPNPNPPPAASASMRQASLGPATPSLDVPPVSSRATSAQPSRSSVVVGARKQLPTSRKRPRPSNRKDRRRALAHNTPSTNASLSEDDQDGSAPPTPSSLQRSQHDGASDYQHQSLMRRPPGVHGGDNDNNNDDDDDQQPYCYCQKVSYGDMVGCDNQNCQYQWFHWECVGLKSEPKGSWLCPTCRKLPKKDLVIETKS
ncbi:hypothetical protein K470DRAFT_258901 [Piedraia hortae CBS 480.64]|uniref:Chromatin modification-related protein YNG2 n=1 Tax=Piedraia hortae CBS 480.64 TaxID=1314780 RepID=A0A6A7BVN8_9PEZI|nr:hypothetical protein K470DRAFT_258901 [Piedraia hortae CBS 480.64]